jgi:hypothetical protein
MVDSNPNDLEEMIARLERIVAADSEVSEPDTKTKALAHKTGAGRILCAFVEALPAVLHTHVAKTLLPFVKVLRGIDTRTTTIESRSWLKYRGVWTEQEQYNEGDLATDHGSLWFARRSTRTRPPSADWQLAAKRGRDGRDARP